MTDRELKYAHFFGGAIVIVGFWILIFSLMGYMHWNGFSRNMDRELGLEIPTDKVYLMRTIIGFALCQAGFALRMKVRKERNESERSEESEG